MQMTILPWTNAFLFGTNSVRPCHDFSESSWSINWGTGFNNNMEKYHHESFMPPQMLRPNRLLNKILCRHPLFPSLPNGYLANHGTMDFTAYLLSSNIVLVIQTILFTQEFVRISRVNICKRSWILLAELSMSDGRIDPFADAESPVNDGKEQWHDQNLVIWWDFLKTTSRSRNPTGSTSLSS